MNVALVRVLYAHALVGAPRLALGRVSALSRLLGDPRVGMAGVFLSLRRVLPDQIPARARHRALYRRRAASRSTARLRGDRATIATPLRMVRRGARRAASARARARRQPDLRLAVRGATRVALPAHTTGRAGSWTRNKAPVRKHGSRRICKPRRPIRTPSKMISGVPESDSLTCQGQVVPKAQHLPSARGRKATKPDGRGDARRSGGEAAAEYAGKSPPPTPGGRARRAFMEAAGIEPAQDSLGDLTRSSIRPKAPALNDRAPARGHRRATAVIEHCS